LNPAANGQTHHTSRSLQCNFVPVASAERAACGACDSDGASRLASVPSIIIPRASMIIRPNREIRTVTEKLNKWITCVVPRLGLGELYARIPATERAESRQRGHMLCVYCTGGAGLFPRILKHGRHDSTENQIGTAVRPTDRGGRRQPSPVPIITSRVPYPYSVMSRSSYV
jgi:hypothetical protein